MNSDQELVQKLLSKVQAAFGGWIWKMGAWPDAEEQAEAADRLTALAQENAALKAEVERLLPWELFYGQGKNLGEIAEECGGSIYDYSPWLTAPCIRISKDAIASKNQQIDALKQRVEALEEHIEEQCTYVVQRIEDGDELHSRVWRGALEDVRRENTAILARLTPQPADAEGGAQP